MSNELIIAKKEDLVSIADAIREKAGTTDTMALDAMAEAIAAIEAGGSETLNEVIDRSITEIGNNEITNIGPYAFYGCSNLTTADFPNVTSISSSAFNKCSVLTTANFPNVTSISGSAFNKCSALTTAIFPNATSIGDEVFEYCSSLTTIDFPNITSIGSEAFNGCSSLTTADFPNVTNISINAFQYCTALTSVNFPNATTIGESVLYGCPALTSVDFPNVTSISRYAFSGCSTLTTLILRSSTMTTLSSTNAFNNTPIASGTGYIYVPSALITSYQTASNWSTYASQFRSIEEGSISTIDGRMVSRNSTVTIELSWYAPIVNPDVIPVVQVSSENTNIISVGNVVISDSTVSFDVTSHSTDGTSIVTLIATIGDDTYTQTATFTVVEYIPECTWTVESVEGVTYEFELNADGYYESTNNGVNSSYSLCKVSFYSNGISNMKLNCINSGESYYDFGILSTVDNTLEVSHAIDSSNVFKSFYGQSSTSVQTVDYGVVTEGDHFIYVKYRKDSSGDDGNDSLQFTVEFV